MNLDSFFAQNEDWLPYADLVVKPPLPEELMEMFSDVSGEVLARCCEFVKEGGGEVTRGAVYVRVRREDTDLNQHQADRWATMLSLNAPPGLQTTDSFWAGRKPWHEVFGEKYANKTKAELAKQGVNLKPGDEYMPELARRPYDPEAVVPFGGARSYIKNLCKKRGWEANGAVTVDHREPERDPYETAPKLAENLVRQKSREMVKSNPAMKNLKRGELREAVIEKFGPSKTVAMDLKNIGK